jgi:hypothetical protein
VEPGFHLPTASSAETGATTGTGHTSAATKSGGQVQGVRPHFFPAKDFGDAQPRLQVLVGGPRVHINAVFPRAGKPASSSLKSAASSRPPATSGS